MQRPAGAKEQPPQNERDERVSAKSKGLGQFRA